MFNRGIVVLVLFVTSGVNAQANAEPDIIAIESCQPERQGDEFLYSSDFKWYYEIQELRDRYSEAYMSPKRLQRRAYWDVKKGEVYMPYDKVRGGPVKVPISFIKSVRQHIELALSETLIDGVFFPDMGHSHFFIPLKKYQENYQDIPTEKFNTIYEKFFSDPELKVLYHTAEQLRLIDEEKNPLPDPYLQHRLRTRNLLGFNDGRTSVIYIQNPESKNNTAHDFPGHHYWGAGFNLSANKNGCFYFLHKGQTYRFDLSLYDLDLDPNKQSEMTY